MITIGVYGGAESGKAMETIGCIIANSNKMLYQCVDFSQYNQALVEKQGYEYSLIAIQDYDIISWFDGPVKLDILVQVSAEKNYDSFIEKLQKVIDCIRQGGYIILNSDEISSMNFKSRGVYVVSYGLNTRATVTASSIDDIQGLSFSYYLQRAVPSIDGSIIQPFEQPVTLKDGTNDLYSCLASYTCALILNRLF